MAHDRLVTWLKDAHSMEKAIGEFAEHIHKHHEDNAEFADVLTSVINKSHEHESAVQDLLSEENLDVSGGKDLIGRLTSFISGAGSNLFHDDDIKDLLALNAVLHFAHGCYVSLGHGAQISNEHDVKNVSDQIAADKETLAQRVLELVPMVTSTAINM